MTDSLGCKASKDTLFTVHPIPVGSLQKTNTQNYTPLSTYFVFIASGSSAVKNSWQINGDLFSGKTFRYCFKSKGLQIIKGTLFDWLTTCTNTLD